MKLIVQIPCFNEEATLGLVLAGIPREIDGIDQVSVVVIDDGSTDRTVEVAESFGVDYLVRNGYNMGLARSFARGVDTCLYLGADIIVNTDGDNQYDVADIPKLIRPIIEGKADVVVGCRDIDNHSEFSRSKKFLQKLGSSVVRRVSGTSVPDTTSGFRAIGRKAAVSFSLMSNFSYTLEMLIQAGRTGLRVASVSIGTNPSLRESRLFKSSTHFIFHQGRTILAAYLFYRPMHFFGFLSGISFVVALLTSFRILYYLWFVGPDIAKIKMGSGILLICSSSLVAIFFIAGLLGAVLSGLRFLMLDVRTRVRTTELNDGVAPLDFEIVEVKKSAV